ncbi:hypothetical protein FKM82_014449 [Ascaphus truei]
MLSLLCYVTLSMLEVNLFGTRLAYLECTLVVANISVQNIYTTISLFALIRTTSYSNFLWDFHGKDLYMYSFIQTHSYKSTGSYITHVFYMS